MKNGIEEQQSQPCLTNPLEVLKAASDISDWGYGRWSYDKWETFNNLYFEGILQPGGIFWGLTPHGRALGYYEGWRNSITLHTSLIEPSTKDPWGIGKLIGERLAEDVLLHEMMHQAVYQRNEHKSSLYGHNSELWCTEVNRLVSILKLDTDLVAKPIRQRRIREPDQIKGKGQVQWVVEEGSMTRIELATFPQSLRPTTYYSSAEQLLRSN